MIPHDRGLKQKEDGGFNGRGVDEVEKETFPIPIR